MRPRRAGKEMNPKIAHNSINFSSPIRLKRRIHFVSFRVFMLKACMTQIYSCIDMGFCFSSLIITLQRTIKLSSLIDFGLILFLYLGLGSKGKSPLFGGTRL